MLATFRHFFSSPHVLSAYTAVPSSEDDLCEKIRQGMQLGLRSEQTRTPDHMHRQRVEHFWSSDTCLTDMLLLALGLSSFLKTSYAPPLYVRGEHVYVQQSCFEEWYNEVVTYQSPVPHIAAAWMRHAQEHHRDAELIVQNVLHSLQHASLPSIHENRLNDLMQNTHERKGMLHDLHTHFNGSTEFTNIWLHAIEQPYAIYTCLKRAYDSSGVNSKAQYFYKQLNTSPLEIFNNLRKAARIRQYMCRFLRSWQYIVGGEGVGASFISHQELVGLLHQDKIDACISVAHPFQHEHLAHNISLLQREAVMWVYIIDALQNKKSHDFAKLVHMYTLLMNLYARLVIHQQDQYGFDQFQYVTCTKAYDPLEDSDSIQRFAQFHGMYGPDLAHIEARFSPKETVKKTVALLQNIWRGYEHQHKAPEGGIIPCTSCPRLAEQYRIRDGSVVPRHSAIESSAADKSTMSLSLVAHFIKGEEGEHGIYRHQRLRTSLAQKARSFVKAKEYLHSVAPDIAKAIVGKDAAGNELDTPPEVFAPIFRLLHTEGIHNTTYHAGEDFEHLLSGIRAVYEAMTFLSLGSGDRIGHATALGISPAMCSSLSIFCAQGHWLDNLVWLTRQIHRSPHLAEYQALSFRFLRQIETLYKKIYETQCPALSTLWEAWELRHLDISLMDTTLYPIDKHTKAEMKKLEDAKDKRVDALKEWQKYHEQKYREAWCEKEKIEESTLSEDFLCALQDSVLHEMREKNIIVEVLPCSNVRISHYTRTHEHHVLRWLDPSDTRPAPHVVLGTDDPGIFATNIRHEYAMLFHMLCKKYAFDDEKPYQIIRHLIDNSRSYRF